MSTRRSKKQTEAQSCTIPPNYDPTLATYNMSHFQELAYQEHIANLKKLMDAQTQEIIDMSASKIKTHNLPLARIKKIMRKDDNVRMISGEVPPLIAKACELFIIELTHLSWIHTDQGKRRTMQSEDIAKCIARTDSFDFLFDLVPNQSNW